MTQLTFLFGPADLGTPPDVSFLFFFFKAVSTDSTELTFAFSSSCALPSSVFLLISYRLHAARFYKRERDLTELTFRICSSVRALGAARGADFA
jgi:hypothetical protein